MIRLGRSAIAWKAGWCESLRLMIPITLRKRASGKAPSANHSLLKNCTLNICIASYTLQINTPAQVHAEPQFSRRPLRLDSHEELQNRTQDQASRPRSHENEPGGAAVASADAAVASLLSSLILFACVTNSHSLPLMLQLQAFNRLKKMKKIDAVTLKNTAIAPHGAFEFEAVRLIAKSDRPSGGNTEDVVYGLLEQDGDSVEFELNGNRRLVAPHSGSESTVKLHFDWADRDPTFGILPTEHFVTFLLPSRPIAPQDCSVQVAVEYPESYPETSYHKISVGYLGSAPLETCEFEWRRRADLDSPWEEFDVEVSFAFETRLQDVRVSSKRFSADSLEYVQIIVRDRPLNREGEHRLPHDDECRVLATVEVLVWAADDQTRPPRPSQGRAIEKKPAGAWCLS